MKQRITIQSIRRKWEDFYSLPFPESNKFPSEGSNDLEGDFLMLDSDLAGCIDSFLSQKKILEPWKRDTLVDCGRTLENKIDLLTEEGSIHYFSDLHSLVNDVLLYLENE